MAAEKIDALQLDVTANASSESLERLIEALNRLSAALNKVDTKQVSDGLNETGNAAEKATTKTNKLSNSFLGQAVKLTAVIALYKKLSSVIGSSIASSANYIKTLNMFTQSMGEYTDTAYKYAQTVSDALGIDPANWIKAQGTFQTLVTGFGVGGKKAAYMSQNLTQLSYDIASFYGITNEEAANKLKSAIAGRLEPIRKLGYDLSQAKLVDIAKNPANYGKQTFKVNEQTGAIEANTKAVDDNTKHKIVNFNQLTQQEKVQLRYIALMTQVTQVQGNYAAALNDPANQMNVFKEQTSMTARALGDLFIPALNKVLPYITAFVQLVGEAFREVAKLFGIEIPNLKDRIGDKKITKPYNDVVKATGKAAKNSKKIKDNFTIGIDELNVLKKPDKTGGAGGGGVGNKKGQNSNLKNLKTPGYDFLGKATENSVKKAKKALQTFLKDPIGVLKTGATELGYNFVEAVMGKPEDLARRAIANGRTVEEEFAEEIKEKAGEEGSKVVEAVMGSPEEMGKRAAESGMTVGDRFTYELQEKLMKNPIGKWLYETTHGGETVEEGLKKAAKKRQDKKKANDNKIKTGRNAAAAGAGVGIRAEKQRKEEEKQAKGIYDVLYKGNKSWEKNWNTTAQLAQQRGEQFGKSFAKGLQKEKENVWNTSAQLAEQYGKGLNSKIEEAEKAGNNLYNKALNGADDNGKADANFKKEGEDSAKSYYQAYWESQVKKNAYNGGKTLGSQVYSGAAPYKPKFKTLGEQSGAGFVAGIEKDENKENAKKASKTLGFNALSFMKKTLGIHSPSTKFMEVGDYSVQGYVKGITDNTYKATSAAQSMSDRVLNTISNAKSLSNKVVFSGSIANPMSSSFSIPSNTNAGYNISAANTSAMASLAGNIYQAVVSGMSNARINTTSDSGDIKVIIDGKEVFKAVQTESRKRGVAISNGAFSR